MFLLCVQENLPFVPLLPSRSRSGPSLLCRYQDRTDFVSGSLSALQPISTDAPGSTTRTDWGWCSISSAVGAAGTNQGLILPLSPTVTPPPSHTPSSQLLQKAQKSPQTRAWPPSTNLSPPAAITHPGRATAAPRGPVSARLPSVAGTAMEGPAPPWGRALCRAATAAKTAGAQGSGSLPSPCWLRHRGRNVRSAMCHIPEHP